MRCFSLRLSLLICLLALPLPWFPPPTGCLAADAGPAEQGETETAQRPKQDVEMLRARQRAARERAVALRGWILPEQVDASDPRIRLLLLLPSGPVLAQADVTIDGQPYRAYREGLVAELLQQADADGDGRLTWSELAQCDAAGRYRQMLAKSSEAFELDDDDYVSMRELRHFLALQYGGTGLSVGPSASQGRVSRPLVFEYLDQNGDRQLDAAEIATARSRLRSQDADDNELLEQSELIGAAAAYRPRLPTDPVDEPYFIRHLNSDTDWDELLTTLELRYGRAMVLQPSSFAHTPGLFEQLDADKNARLSADELARLLEVPPHLELRVRLGERKAKTQPLEVTHVGDDLRLDDQTTAKGDGALLLAFDQTLLRIDIREQSSHAQVRARQAKTLVQRFDKDKNGYLDREEVKSVSSLADQFSQWDADGNGMVFEEELRGYYERQQEPRQHQASIAAGERPYPLLTAMDSNGDQRLTLRELRSLEKSLQALDRNGDGRLAWNELPRTIHWIFSRSGYAQYGLQAQTRPRAFRRPTTEQPDGPEWFTAMDRNRDGDVSRREFPGTADQFEALDRDGDTLIDLSEATAATSGEAGRE